MAAGDVSTVTQYLEDLRDAGFDLSQPALVEHYLYFPVASLAHAAALDLRGQGYDVDVEEDGERPGWIVYVSRRMQASAGRIAHMRDTLATSTVARGGDYEGWNVVPEPDDVPGEDEFEEPD